MRAPCRCPDLRAWQVSDGYTIHGRVWPPAGPARTAILYLHGIQSHGGWFEWSAARLAEAGHLVVLPDRRGSGRNEAQPGDTPSAERWLADIDEITAWCGREFGATRLGVVGVSWGGKLATTWSLKRTSQVAALLLVAPGLFPLVDLGWAAKLGVALALLARPRQSFPIPLSDPELFTDDPDGQRFIAEDARKLTHVTARFLWCSRRLDRQLYRVGPRELCVPLTLALAGRERIIRNEPTQAWAEHVAGTGLRVVRFPDAAHTLEFETDPGLFGNLLDEWARNLRAS